MDHNKRIDLACVECRRRKRKCDGRKPQCSSCQAQERDCVYDHERSNRKRKRDPEEVEQLEEQIEILLQRVKELENEASSGISTRNATLGSTSSLTKPGMDGLSGASSDQETRSASAVDEVGNLMWKLKIDSNGDTSFIGPSSNFQFISAAQESRSDNQLQSNPIITASDMPLSDQCLADEALQQELFDVFNSVVNPSNQFLDPIFLNNFDVLSARANLDEILLRTAMFALAACFSARENATHIGDIFYKSAENIVQQCCRSCPSLITVRALSMLCWRDLTLDNENTAWMYNCMGAALTTQLGLHVVNLQNIAGISPESKDSRIRTFWLWFRIDRIATFSLGRQCCIPWTRIRTPWLESILTSSATLPELVLNYECQLLLLFDKYMDQIYSFQFHDLDSQSRNKLLFDAREALCTFYNEMNRQISSERNGQSSATISLRMTYHMCLILVQRPLLREDSNGALYRMAVQSSNSSAVAITNLLRDYRKAGCLRTAPFVVVHHVLTAAIMHLLSVTSSNGTLRKRSITRFRECIEALGEMKYAWKRLRKAIALLQELAHRWSVVFALPMRLSYPLPAHSQNDISSQPKDQSSMGYQLTADSEAYNKDSNFANSYSADKLENLPLKDELPATEINGGRDFTNSDFTMGIYEMGDPFQLNDMNWLFPPIDQP
ncbi:putative c6 transcription factor protein [Botrytis fragariae]|uniref:Putative c6 transcription factor protein n=1 Tax=Botrytis fragariae TaxID=1964551 RepID=A0A8H6AWG3_9HELO|nr:putative c6 transcription factor protein [Botrytis fragariae]KAF5874857.1 putative c6 transcription factor protein [Botrytis fragariae]